MSPPALALRGLTVRHRAAAGGRGGSRWVVAVRGVDLELEPGEALGLVGESGCGKSTLARAAAGLIAPDAGAVEVGGRDLGRLRGRDLRRARREVQLVFQDPAASLNPRLRLGAALAEAAGPGAAPVAAAELLREVGLPPAWVDRLPHELSGGQRQRVALARALATSPRVLIADEPTSGLDVPVQARILAALRRSREQRGLALLLISHDIVLVRKVCRRVAVMLAGLVVEVLPAGAEPLHPYARALAAATPSLSAALAGAAPAIPPPAAAGPPPAAGCPYRLRCPLCEASCAEALPALASVAEKRLLRCPIVRRRP